MNFAPRRSQRPRFALRAVLLVILPGLLAVLGGAAHPAAALDLELSTVKVQGGEFRFHTSLAEPVPKLPIRPDGENVQVASTPRYTVYADFKAITYTKYGFFRYRLYVHPKPGAPGMSTSFTVHGDPVGDFPVQMTEVDLAVGEGSLDQCKIMLPVFSLESTGYLAGPTWSEPLEVELPGETEVSLQLRNLLEKWPVSVTGVRQPSRKGIWHTAELMVRGSDRSRALEIRPASKVDDALVLRLVPSSAQALSKVLFPRAGQAQHELVTASVDYATPWGVESSLEIQVPVRFVPWPPLLFVAVAFGTLLGSLIPVVAGQRRRTKWPRAFAASLMIAIVVELLAMVLVYFDSEFRLLGVEIDPFQLPPAGLIGVFMGLMGFRSLDLLKKLIAGLENEGEEARS
jgi:hypothetical protein